MYKGIKLSLQPTYVRLNDEFDIYYLIDYPRRYLINDSRISDFKSNASFTNTFYSDVNNSHCYFLVNDYCYYTKWGKRINNGVVESIGPHS